MGGFGGKSFLKCEQMIYCSYCKTFFQTVFLFLKPQKGRSTNNSWNDYSSNNHSSKDHFSKDHLSKDHSSDDHSLNNNLSNNLSSNDNSTNEYSSNKLSSDNSWMTVTGTIPRKAIPQMFSIVKGLIL